MEKTVRLRGQPGRSIDAGKTNKPIQKKKVLKGGKGTRTYDKEKQKRKY